MNFKKQNTASIFVFCIVMALLTGCNNQQPPSATTESEVSTTEWLIEGDEPTVNPEADMIPDATYSNGTPYSVFGSMGEFALEANDVTVKFGFNLPAHTVQTSSSKITLHTEENRDKIVIDNASKYEAFSDIEDVLPKLAEYLDKEEKALTNNKGSVELKRHEIVEFNGRQFGKALYTISGNGGGETVLAYTTQLSNGAYVYWILSNGVSFVSTRQCAENMAMTFREISTAQSSES